MSLEQKIGQMVSVPITYDGGVKLIDHYLGNVFYPHTLLGDKGERISKIQGRNDQIWNDMRAHSQQQGAPFIPPFICSDAINGNHIDSKAVMFPIPQAWGAANSLELTYQIGKATTEQFIASGVNCRMASSFARSITEDPYEQVKQISSFFNGSQENYKILDSIFAMDFDEHAPTVEQKLNYSSLIAALNQGVLAVNVDFKNSNETVKLLKENMGFQGIVLGSVNELDDINGCWAGSCDSIINRGVDIITFAPERFKDKVDIFVENTIDSVKLGKISVSRIDNAVNRILSVKMHMGLFDGVLPSQRGEQIGSIKNMEERHETLANTVAKESAVLLKNMNNLLPMDRVGNYLIAGDALEDTKYQLGKLNNKNADKLKDVFKKLSKDSTMINPLFSNFFSIQFQMYIILFP